MEKQAEGFVRGRAAGAVLAAAAASSSADRSPAALLQNARTQHLLLLAQPAATSTNAAWTPVGPVQVTTAAYGAVTGRVTATAFDPSDPTGNTVFVGTTGGGVWKSTNAAGAASSVVFSPLTDTSSAFSPNAGSSGVPSLSIGAVAVQPGGTGVVLAGTGDPNDAADSYYGSGLLRSTDGGTTWALIAGGYGGSFVGEGFAGFAWSTTSPQVVVAAVSSAAEAATVGRSRYPGVRGLYYSLDAGATWTVATVQDGSTVIQSAYNDYGTFRGNAATAVVWNPVRHRFYAAIRLHGYYESADGITWTRLQAQPGTGLTTANCPSRAGTYGLGSCPIFRGALAAQAVSGDLFALTVDAVNNNGGLWQDACGSSAGSCASGTVRWTAQLDSTPLEDGGKILSGDYNLVLAAVPAATSLQVNDTLLFAGTTDLFRCGLAGGCLLRNTTNTANGCAAPAGVAPAQHSIAWQSTPGDTSRPRILLGNDGGIWRSLDGVRQTGPVCSADDALHFDNLNSGLGSLAEVSGFSSHPTDPNVLLAALGGNGSAAATTAAQAGAQAAWSQIGTGESGTVAIDQSDGRTWLVQSGAGVNLHTCGKGTSCAAADFAGVADIGSAQISGDTSPVDAPALLDPALNTNVLVGTCRVYRGPVAGGSAWTGNNALSRPFAGPNGGACSSSNGQIRSLAAGGTAVTASRTPNGGSPVLYAGLAGIADGGSTFGGHLYVTSAANTATASTTWRDAATSPVTNGNGAGFNPGGFDISGIAVDPSDGSGRTVYATVMGFGFPHIYRSTDAGTTWLNISANLPDAPANAVAVDPNTPRTVYVATDTGVYAAADVTTCVDSGTGVTGSCWAAMGTGLPNSPVTALNASNGLTVGGIAGVLRAGTYGRGIWQMPLLSAGQILQPAATFAPGSLTFSTQDVGSTSNAQAATLTNTGNAVLRITSVVTGSDFAETDTCTGATLGVGASCSLQVTFTPSTTGAIGGSIAVRGNLSGGYASLPVSGTGRGVANLAATPTSLLFPSTALGSTAAAQSVTVTNGGTGAAALGMPAISQDFSLSGNSCGGTLPAGASCCILAGFTPSQNAREIGTLSIPYGTGTLQGTGTGTARVTLSPASPLDFGAFPVNGYRGVATVTVSNSGNTTVTLGAPSADNDFGVYRNDCNTLLGAGASCTVVLTFGATQPGTRTGTFSISDGTAAHTLSLMGTGNATNVSFFPTALTFGTVDLGSASAPQRVTVTNAGATALLWGTPLTAAGDFSLGENSCVQSLAVGSSCSFTVLFVPAADGTRYGTLTIADQYTTHTVSAVGSGRGQASIAVAPASLDFGTVAVGDSSPTQTLTVSNTGTAAATLPAVTVTGDFVTASTTCGPTLAAGASCTYLVLFAPQSEGQRTGSFTLNGTFGSRSAGLSGNAAGSPAIVLSPSPLSFGGVALRSTSGALTIGVRNRGNGTASLGTATVTGDFSLASNGCAAALAPGASCSLTVTFTPTAPGMRSGTFTLPDTAGSHAIALSGTGLQGALALSPAALAFPDTAVAAASAAKTVVLANTGTAPVEVSSIAASGDYSTGGECIGTLAASQTCTVSVLFRPAATGGRPGTLTVLGTSAGSALSATAALSGNGAGAFNIVLTPTAIDFGAQPAGSTSGVRNITVSNTGTTTGALAGVVVSGDFSLRANTCGTALPPQTGCTVSVVFTPTAAGRRNGTLTVTDDAGTQTASVTGTGISAATDTLSPLSLTFASQQVNTGSALQSVTLTNSGDTALTLISAQILSGDFTATNGCGPTLPAQSSCSIRVAFTPRSTGALTGLLQVTDVQRSQTVALSGTAIAGPGVSLTPSSLTFAATGVGVSTAGQTLTVTNNGGVPVLLSGVSVTGDFGILSGSSTCTTTDAIPVGGSCSFAVAFAPAAAGARSGTVTVTGSAPTLTAQLSGTGVDFQFSAAGSTTATISSGGSAVFPLLLRPAIGVAMPVTFACAGVPANARCTVTSQYGDLSATQTVTLTVLTGTTPLLRFAAAGFLAPLLVLLPWRRRRAVLRSACAWVFLSSVILLSSCGSGIRTAVPGSGGTSGGGGGTGPVTPGGTYNITASATAAGVTHSVPLTLVVK